MRAFFSSLILLFACVALATVSIAYAFPAHSYVGGSFLILGMLGSVLIYERYYVGRDVVALAKRDANLMLAAWQVREFLRRAHFPALWGVVLGLGSAVTIMYCVPIDLTEFLIIFGGVFAVTIVFSLTLESWLSSQRRLRAD